MAAASPPTSSGQIVPLKPPGPLSIRSTQPGGPIESLSSAAATSTDGSVTIPTQTSLFTTTSTSSPVLSITPSGTASATLPHSTISSPRNPIPVPSTTTTGSGTSAIPTSTPTPTPTGNDGTQIGSSFGLTILMIMAWMGYFSLRRS